MTFAELQIQLDINEDTRNAVLDEYASMCSYGYVFVDSDDGQCYLFDKNGQLDDISKIHCMTERQIRKDIAKTIVVPESILNIDYWTFRSCICLENVIIPNSVKAIEGWAFEECTSLKNLLIPYSVKYVGRGAFNGCISLNSIEFKDRTIDDVKHMENYPWGIKDITAITCAKSRIFWYNCLVN